MRRREFVGLVGAAAALPPVARAQQRPKIPTIGYLGANSASAMKLWTDAFVQRLSELGWVNDRTVGIEFRWADGRSERYTEIADEFVRLKVDVVVTVGAAVVAAKQATSAIPIVFAVANNPVGIGLVASLARPGGNVTGLSNQTADLAGKRLELLRELVPGLHQLAIMANFGYPASVLEMHEVETSAHALGLEVIAPKIRRAEDIALAFEELKGRAEALSVITDPLMVTNWLQINRLAQRARLPTIGPAREYAESGALASYGANYPHLFGRAAEYVDKILRGANPSDIPVEQPTKFDLVVNLKTAKALGITVPPTLLARADEVIE
jgi:putative tryptophan/tyrosine transport system substrate-binding protein